MLEPAHRPARHDDRPISAADAERLYGIPASTVRSWHYRRGQTGLEPTGLDHNGRPLFRAVDLERLRRGEPIRDADGEWIDPA